MTANGAPSLAATMRKPGAKAVTLSPWLIHTWWRSPTAHRPSNKAHSSVTVEEGAAELAAALALAAAGLDGAAQLVAHHLLAVADAKDRQAAVEHGLRRARAILLGHAGGGAGQDDALGREPLERGVGRL